MMKSKLDGCLSYLVSEKISILELKENFEIIETLIEDGEKYE